MSKRFRRQRTATLIAAVLALVTFDSTGPAPGWGAEERARSERPAIEDSIAVRRVNVDVAVTQKDGTPRTGLTREDFEIRVGRRSVPISNFSEIRAGTEESSAQEGRPVVAVVVDTRTGELSTRRQLLGDLRSGLDRLLEGSAGVLVASVGRRLQLELPLSRDSEQIGAALDALDDAVVGVGRGQADLLRRIDRGRPLVVGDDVLNDQSVNNARALIADIRAFAQSSVYDTSRTALQLRHLVKALTTLPQRSLVVLVSGGLESSPAELAYRLWWSKYQDIAFQLGVATVESELSRFDGGGDLRTLIDEAAASRVTFYVLGSGQRNRLGGSAEMSGGNVLPASLVTVSSPLEALRSLADDTGGLAAVRANRAGHLLDALVRDLDSYYSLAFDPSVVGENEGRIRVRVRPDGLEVRAPRRFRLLAEDDALERLLYASLYLDAGLSELDIGVEIADVRALEDDRYAVALLVTLPVPELTLLPSETFHHGRLEVAVAARAENGGSRAARAQIPVEIPNAELLDWMGRIVGGRLELTVSSQRQKVAIAVQDATGRRASTVNLIVDPTARGRG